VNPDRLIVFDVDGTLTATTGVDDHCLATAWSRVFGIHEEDIDTDWTTYQHSTDDGLTLEVCRRALKRDPTSQEVGEVKHEFFTLLRERIGADPSRCIPVPGAAALLAHLAGEGCRIGLASGAWQESAQIKLEAAGIKAMHLPGTFSHPKSGPSSEKGGTGGSSASDAATATPATREDIIQGTLNKLSTQSPPSSRPLYIGDGPWDARAARNLSLAFIGIRVDNNHSRLEAQGARTIFQNYTNLPAILHAITTATTQ
jgi:phosphoglycolate phosphatase-like HAD superfamily hydrolase